MQKLLICIVRDNLLFFGYAALRAGYDKLLLLLINTTRLFHAKIGEPYEL